MGLAQRYIEQAGIPTVSVTNMPFVTEQVRVPRAVAVEFPFGHPLGLPGRRDLQRAVVEASLDLAQAAREPGTIKHLALDWPDPRTYDYPWHPPEPAPILKMMRGG